MKSLQGAGKLFLFVLICTISIQSCKHDDGVLPTVVKSWNALELKSVNEVPAPVGRTEEGEVTMELLSDHSLKFDFHIHNLTPGDALTAAHMHFGNAGESSGPVILNLNPAISGSAGTGIVKNLRPTLVDTLMNQTIYFNVHSTQAPAGIVRVQIDKKVDFAMDIPLTGNNEVPGVITTATGVCILRMTEDKILYSKVTITNIEAGDTLRVSHIHRGATGSNGPVRVTLVNNLSEFGMLRTTTLADSVYAMIKTDPMYINGHSKLRGAGLVRGQIR